MFGNDDFKKHIPQFFAVISSTLGVISDGMQYGWASPAIEKLKEPNSPVHVPDGDDYWLETLYMLGSMIGLPLTIYFVDRFGRKKGILLAAFGNCLSWLMIMFASNIYVLYIARTLSGIGSDVAFVSAPMYIAEISSAKIRGFLATFVYIMMIVGVVIIYSVGSFVPIHVSAFVGFCIAFSQLVTFPFMPESPYFLLLKGKKEAARKALSFLRRGNESEVEEELELIENVVLKQEQESHNPLNLFKQKNNRRSLIIIVGLAAAQSFSGISVILMNLHKVLARAGAQVSPSFGAIAFASTMLLSSIIASLFIDKFGRKILLILSSLLTSISLMVLGTYFLIQKYNWIDLSDYTFIPFVACICYALVDKFGLGLVPIVLTGELFPTSVKAAGMTLGDVTYVIMGICSIELFYSTFDSYGLHVPFYVFAVSCLANVFFTLFYIPETKGKTLDEIQTVLKKSRKKKSTLPANSSGVSLESIQVTVNTCNSTVKDVTKF